MGSLFIKAVVGACRASWRIGQRGGVANHTVTIVDYDH